MIKECLIAVVQKNCRHSAVCLSVTNVLKCGSSFARVTCGKAKFCLRMVRWFFSGFFGFRPPLMNDRLDISEIFLKGP